jgi:hypothetical protein
VLSAAELGDGCVAKLFAPAREDLISVFVTWQRVKQREHVEEHWQKKAKHRSGQQDEAASGGAAGCGGGSGGAAGCGGATYTVLITASSARSESAIF